ncbi:MAG: hypothetical protein Q8P27_01555 [Candidatus Peregrinibacteria bacterium]|nr:hypothetical protein [Candidatus Peregrinibacteria bacterium]
MKKTNLFKLLALMSLLVLTVALTGCGAGDDAEEATDEVVEDEMIEDEMDETEEMEEDVDSIGIDESVENPNYDAEVDGDITDVPDTEPEEDADADEEPVTVQEPDEDAVPGGEE